MKTEHQRKSERDRLLEEMDKEARKSLSGPIFEIATAGQVS